MDVSIVIPGHNVAWCVPQLAQNLQNCLTDGTEIIFVDDGSTDESSALVRARLPQAICLSQEHEGVGAARNLGVEHARGEFIQLLDADDTLIPGKLGAQLKCARERDGDVVFSDWRMLLFRGDQRVEEPIVRSGTPNDMVAALLGGWWFPTASGLVRKSAYTAVGGCDVTLRNTCDDFHLWVQLAIHGARYVYCPGHFSNYHRYEDRASVSRRQPADFYSGEAAIIENALAALATRKQLTPARRHAAARRLHRVARNAYVIDPAWYGRLYRRVAELDPQFHPEGSFVYRTLWAILGHARAEYVALRLRQWRTGERGIQTRGDEPG